MAGLLRLVSRSSNRSNNHRTPHGRASQLAPRSRGRASATHADSGPRSGTSNRCAIDEAEYAVLDAALARKKADELAAAPS